MSSKLLYHEHEFIIHPRVILRLELFSNPPTIPESRLVKVSENLLSSRHPTLLKESPKVSRGSQMKRALSCQIIHPVIFPIKIKGSGILTVDFLLSLRTLLHKK